MGLLIIIGLFLGTVPSHAQVISDGNVEYQSASSSNTTTISGFSVPSGSNSLLVVYTIATSLNTTANVTFDGIALTKLGELASNNSLSIWYLTQGDLASPTSGNIVATFSASPLNSGIYAISYKDVDQITPMENFGSNDFGTATVSSISVNSDSTNDLIVDFITARNNGGTPTLTEGAGQTKLGEQDNQASNSAGFNSTYALSQEPSDGSAIDMDWTISDHSSTSSYHIAANINGDITVIPPEVPTLSEWGLILLALLLMTFGTLYLVQPNWRGRFEQEG